MLALRQAPAETSLDTILHPARTRFSGLVNAKFRLAVAADIGALVDLENRSFSSDRISARSFRRLVASPSAAVIVAVAGQALGGYAVLLFRAGSSTARIYSLAVDPAFAWPRPRASCSLRTARRDARQHVDPARGPRGQCPRHQSLRAHDLFSLRGDPALLCGRRHRAAIRKAGSAAGKLRTPCRNHRSMSFVSPANANRQSRLPRPGVTHANAIGFATHENR